MTNSNSDVASPSYENFLSGLFRDEGFVRATFGGVPRRVKGTKLRRVVVRAIELRGERMIQVSRFDEKKDRTTNYHPNALITSIADVIAAGFASVHVTTAEEEIDVRLTKKGETQVGRKKRAIVPEESEAGGHNRVKDVPLPEGRADAVLQAMGIMTESGTIRPPMRAKFTQINEFLKLLEQALEHVDVGEKPLAILDCGSGSSYLTLAAHHYLNDVVKRPAHVLGVDVNAELVKKSQQRAQSLLGEMEQTLQFATGKIGALEGIHVDVVVALHACDTATDDALVQAIRSDAQVVLAAPCCHQDLNGKLEVAGMEAVHKFGILHQRFADIVTDTCRAMILRAMGYRAEVVEFISSEHTARNLMIRAVKTSKGINQSAVAEYEAFKKQIGVTPYLDSALEKVSEKWKIRMQVK